MNTEPLISIIIPTYNSEKFLPMTLRSVLGQTYQNFEIFVIDDNSKDRTSSLFEKTGEFYLDKINYMRLNRNYGGPAGPTNIGVQLARGEYICFLDSDDVWNRDKLEFQVNVMRERHLSFTSTRRISFESKIPEAGESQSKDIYFTFNELLKKNIIITSSVMLKSSLIKELKFNETKERIAVEDYEMWLDIFQRYQLTGCVLGNYLTYYRLHPLSISKSKYKMIKKVWSLLGDKKYSLSYYSRVKCFIMYILHSTVWKIIE